MKYNTLTKMSLIIACKICNQFLLASKNSNSLPGWGSEKDWGKPTSSDQILVTYNIVALSETNWFGFRK